MTRKELPSAEQLRQLLEYDRDTGALRRRDGRKGVSRHTQGYVCISICGQTFLAHRVIWAMAYDRWPTFIDHINGVRDDNRLVNLREVTRFENQKNMTLSSRNTSGVTGVSWHKASQKWSAQIYANGNLEYLGLFAKKEDAIEARQAANKKYNFSSRHGKKTS